MECLCGCDNIRDDGVCVRCGDYEYVYVEEAKNEK